MGAEKRIHKEWLDAALKARADCEPRVGLEDRVLARLASEPPRRALAWWPTIAAVAAIVVIAIALTISWPNQRGHSLASTPPRPATRSRSGGNPSLRTPVVAAVGKPTVQVHPRSTSGRRDIRKTQQEQLPKLATFPAPQPETPEERLLMRLAARRGSVDVAGITSDFSSPQELSIPRLKIDPMEGTPPDDTPQE